MSEITQILSQFESDPSAAEQLLPLVYDELRKLAAGYLANERPGQTLEATGLVHEAYLRLVGPTGERTFANRAHFFSAAAEAMRRILIDAARRKRALKRREVERPVDLSRADLFASTIDADSWIDLDNAITAFEAIDRSTADLAKLRIFAGLSVEEAGETLGMSRATAFRAWTYARAWLTAMLAERPENF